MSVLHLAQRTRRSLLAGPTGAMPPTLPAQAQQLPDMASFSLADAKLQNLGAAEVVQPHRLVLLNVTAASRGQTQVQQDWYGKQPRVRRPARLMLPERSLHLPLLAAGR